MREYDPQKTPNPREWLSLDEARRIALVSAYHVAHSEDCGASVRMHAGIHAAVETQLAMKMPAVKAAFARLRKRGLSRHDAIHAVGMALAAHMRDSSREDGTDDGAERAYFERLEQL
jgi:hypothetical protein